MPLSCLLVVRMLHIGGYEQGGARRFALSCAALHRHWLGIKKSVLSNGFG
jgi:hypothetical protein